MRYWLVFLSLFFSALTHLPLLDHGAQFVCRHVHAMKVGQHIATLHFFGHQPELAECNLVILEISK